MHINMNTFNNYELLIQMIEDFDPLSKWSKGFDLWFLCMEKNQSG